MYLDPDGCEVVTDRDTTWDLLPTYLGMVGQGGGGYVCAGGVDKRGRCKKMQSVSEYTWQSHDAKAMMDIEYQLLVINYQLLSTTQCLSLRL